MLLQNGDESASTGSTSYMKLNDSWQVTDSNDLRSGVSEGFSTTGTPTPQGDLLALGSTLERLGAGVAAGAGLQGPGQGRLSV